MVSDSDDRWVAVKRAMKDIHTLLKDQLRQYFNSLESIPKEWQGFIEAVNNAYWQSDVDRTERKQAEQEIQNLQRQILQPELRKPCISDPADGRRNEAQVGSGWAVIDTDRSNRTAWQGHTCPPYESA